MKQLLAFILLSGLVCWMMFAPIYKHVAIVRQALLQQEVDYLLEVGANAQHGFIDEDMIRQSIERLEKKGFHGGSLEYSVTTTGDRSGTHAFDPVLRGDSIMLEIRYPYRNLFAIDRLIGLSGPDPGAHMAASGIKMSEFVEESGW